VALLPRGRHLRHVKTVVGCFAGFACLLVGKLVQASDHMRVGPSSTLTERLQVLLLHHCYVSGTTCMLPLGALMMSVVD
jgi:hypothetical protein